ncbi:hypothetical protein TIFTF001_029157 [Ficus carica]|uniref:Uncharacterized protein n=1 Tax=Ficus carica TaxID=3494 RepID=A0AA88DRA8_FICCA|nr:hypothetical protein TIFTF001_029157 [Ficus carica]
MTHKSKSGSHDQTHYQSTNYSIPRISCQRVPKHKASQSGARGSVSHKLLAQIVGSWALYHRPQKGCCLGPVLLESLVVIATQLGPGLVFTITNLRVTLPSVKSAPLQSILQYAKVEGAPTTSISPITMEVPVWEEGPYAWLNPHLTRYTFLASKPKLVIEPLPT